MKLKLIAIGIKMPAWVATGFGDYHKRIQPMITTELTELPAVRRQKNSSNSTIAQYRQTEGENILSVYGGRGKLWVLDVRGNMLSTERLADKLQTAMTDGDDICFVIGGADGVSKDVLDRADFKWSLSDLTLPHPLVRIVLMEQLYRAMSTLNNHPYHRAN